MIHPLRYQHGFLADGSIFEGLWSALNVFRQRLVSVLPLRKIHYQNLTIVNELSTWSRTGSAHRTALSLSTDRSEYKYLRSFCSLLVGTHNVLNRLCQYGLRYHFCRRYDGFEFYCIGVAVLLITWIGSGGAAACVTAGRLAEADPSLKILVSFQKMFRSSVLFWSQIAQIVEAGPHTRDEPNHIQPGRYLRCLLRPTETFTFHVAKPSSALCDRSVVVPTGRALGGGSSVNCMKAILVINTQTEVMIWSSLLHKGGGFGLRRLGKRIWE